MSESSGPIVLRPRRFKGYQPGAEIWQKRWGSSKSNSGKTGKSTKHYLGSIFSTLYATWKAKHRSV